MDDEEWLNTSVRDMQIKYRDGSLDLSMVLDPSEVFKAMCLALFDAMMGEENEEPPNYRVTEFSMCPANEFEWIRLFAEVVKPGGRSSHQIRLDLEAENARLRSLLKEVAECHIFVDSLTTGIRDGHLVDKLRARIREEVES